MQVVVHTLPMLDTTSTDTRTAVNRKPPAANSKIAPANTKIKTKSFIYIYIYIYVCVLCFIKTKKSRCAAARVGCAEEVARGGCARCCAQSLRTSCARRLRVLVVCPVLFCAVLSCPVLSRLSRPVLSCPVLPRAVLSCLVLSHPVPSRPVLSCTVSSCPVLCSPVPSVPNEFDGSASSCAVGCARGCALVARELRALRVHPSPSDRRSRHTAFTQRQACQRDSSDRQALQTDWHSR